MKDWINKHFRHERDKVGDSGFRAFLHIGVGYLIGATFPLSYPLLLLFVRYQENEDKWTEDKAWKDYAGAMIGAGLGLLTEVGVIIFYL